MRKFTVKFWSENNLHWEEVTVEGEDIMSALMAAGSLYRELETYDCILSITEKP